MNTCAAYWSGLRLTWWENPCALWHVKRKQTKGKQWPFQDCTTRVQHVMANMVNSPHWSCDSNKHDTHLHDATVCTHHTLYCACEYIPVVYTHHQHCHVLTRIALSNRLAVSLNYKHHCWIQCEETTPVSSPCQSACSVNNHTTRFLTRRGFRTLVFTGDVKTWLE